MATITPVASAVPGVFAFSMQAQQSIVVDPKSPGSINSPHGLILFDGVCVLCSRGCGFVSKRDRRGYFRFVPMQLAEGRPLAEQLGINPDRPDSFAFVANGQAYVKSEAVLRIARELPRWQWTWLFHFIPRVIRDAIYDLVARNRYRWFGRRDACILPNSDRSWRSGTAPRLRDDGAWRRLAAAKHDKGSGVTGALMAAFSLKNAPITSDMQAVLLNDRNPLSV